MASVPPQPPAPQGVCAWCFDETDTLTAPMRFGSGEQGRLCPRCAEQARRAALAGLPLDVYDLAIALQRDALRARRSAIGGLTRSPWLDAPTPAESAPYAILGPKAPSLKVRCIACGRNLPGFGGEPLAPGQSAEPLAKLKALEDYHLAGDRCPGCALPESVVRQMRASAQIRSRIESGLRTAPAEAPHGDQESVEPKRGLESTAARRKKVGRPTGSGRFPSAADCERALIAAYRRCRHELKPLTYASVAEVLSRMYGIEVTEGTVLTWVYRFRLDRTQMIEQSAIDAD